MRSHRLYDQFIDCIYMRTFADSENLSLFTDYQDIGVQDLCEDSTNIIKHHFAGIIIMQ